MKFSIHGFYQPRAVELGLTNDDLLVLRWFVDFAGTNKMKTIIESDGIYYWINYSTILEDLPVLNISKVTLKRKHFDKLCETKVLKHKHIKQGGSFSYYAYGINYDTLIYLQDDTPSTNLDHPSTNLDKGYDEIVLTPSTNLDHPYDENVQTKINLLNNTSINNKSINNKKEIEKQLKDEFEQIWVDYPNKQGKSNALKSYIKARTKDKVEYQVVKDGLNKYLTYCEQNKDWYSPKNGSTWFNQQSWNDEFPNKGGNNNAINKRNNSKARDGSEYAEYD